MKLLEQGLGLDKIFNSLISEKPPQNPAPTKSQATIARIKTRSCHTARTAWKHSPHPGAPAMSDEDLRAEIEQLRRENDALKKTSAKGLSMKVSEKGALSIYGLGRFPVTLYKEQWTKLLAMAEEIKTFIQANDSQLKAKD